MYLEYMCTTPTTNNKTIDTSLFSLFYIFSSPDPKGSFFHHLVQGPMGILGHCTNQVVLNKLSNHTKISFLQILVHIDPVMSDEMIKTWKVNGRTTDTKWWKPPGLYNDPRCPWAPVLVQLICSGKIPMNNYQLPEYTLQNTT
jgi:hypothetical protein